MRLTRVTLAIILLIIASGFYLLLREQLNRVEPQVFQATEESLVDTAQLLASIIESDLRQENFNRSRYSAAFQQAAERRFQALIHGHPKSRFGLGAYITDHHGKVLFDSQGLREGLDYSDKRDVALTLQGKYGARSTRNTESDETTSIMYIGALLGPKHEPWGVVTVYKAQADMLPIVRQTRRDIGFGTLLVSAGIIALVAVVFIWQYRPISLLTEYARKIEQGGRPHLPRLGAGREVNTLARALVSMREALEGRRYAENYIQTLTHELKSPLAAIRGAAELLDEHMPAEDRQRFLGNIRAETARAERLLSRLLELSAIEGLSQLDQVDRLDLLPVIHRALDQAQPPAELAQVTLQPILPDSPVLVRGDAFLLRSAITNLLENAIDFSPPSGTVRLIVDLPDHRHARIRIIDQGPGIPDYARDRIFERFYSLKHHLSGRKGTGLGLTLVREAAQLHNGTVRLLSEPGSGTTAELILPLA